MGTQVGPPGRETTARGGRNAQDERLLLRVAQREVGPAQEVAVGLLAVLIVRKPLLRGALDPMLVHAWGAAQWGELGREAGRGARRGRPTRPTPLSSSDSSDSYRILSAMTLL